MIEETQTCPPPLELLKEELEECKDKYLRLLADTENMRKRVQKEKQESVRFAVDNAIAELLLPIDTFENALKFTDQMSQETRNWAMGFKMILTQFHDLLQNHGIYSFSSQGALFDPHRHEAVEVVESEEHPEGYILQEFVKGYRSEERILRPARVKVAKRPSNIKSEDVEATLNKEEIIEKKGD